jgi:hypothetical protein
VAGAARLVVVAYHVDGWPYDLLRVDEVRHMEEARDLLIILDFRLIALSFWISFRGKWETRQRKV